MPVRRHRQCGNARIEVQRARQQIANVIATKWRQVHRPAEWPANALETAVLRSDRQITHDTGARACLTSIDLIGLKLAGQTPRREITIAESPVRSDESTLSLCFARTLDEFTVLALASSDLGQAELFQSESHWVYCSRCEDLVHHCGQTLFGLYRSTTKFRDIMEIEKTQQDFLSAAGITLDDRPARFQTFDLLSMVVQRQDTPPMAVLGNLILLTVSGNSGLIPTMLQEIHWPDCGGRPIGKTRFVTRPFTPAGRSQRGMCGEIASMKNREIRADAGSSAP